MFCYLEVTCPNSDTDSLVKVPASLFIAEESADLKRPSLCYTVTLFSSCLCPHHLRLAMLPGKLLEASIHSFLPTHPEEGGAGYVKTALLKTHLFKL